MPRSTAKPAKTVSGDLIPAQGKRPVGNPTKRSPAIDAYICQELAKGIPLTVICKGTARADELIPADEVPRPAVMPAPRTVRDWQEQDKDFAAAVARAREIGEEALLEQCLEIADNEEHDWELTKKGMVTNEVAMARAKLQVWTRLEMLKKINPRRWGDKQQIEHSGKIGLENLVAGEPDPT